MVLLVAAVMALPGVAQSAMWVGGELGANFVANVDLDVKDVNGTSRFKGLAVDPSVIGGITIGYDFVNTGFGGYNYPDWMKYFGFATDFTYNRLNLRSQFVSATFNGVSVGKDSTDRVAGYVAAWTFLFYGHYGFFPDSEVPAGRLHPYIGVGPAVVFSGLRTDDLGSKSATNVALVTEAGLRFMALPNVSLDLAFRYRYTNPSYSFSHTGAAGVDRSAEISPNGLNQFSILTRVSYHF